MRIKTNFYNAECLSLQNIQLVIDLCLSDPVRVSGRRESSELRVLALAGPHHVWSRQQRLRVRHQEQNYPDDVCSLRSETNVQKRGGSSNQNKRSSKGESNLLFSLATVWQLPQVLKIVKHFKVDSGFLLKFIANHGHISNLQNSPDFIIYQSFHFFEENLVSTSNLARLLKLSRA